MDPSIFTQYSPPSGAPNELPLESKLTKYMNLNASTPVRPLNQAMGNLSLESSPQSMKKVMINEFIPMAYYQPSIMPQPPDNSASLMASHLAMPTTPQVHQENVGGTTYFYSTNSDNLNTSGLNSSSSLASEACMASALATAGTSPYASQMFVSTSPHLNPMGIKPAGGWQLPMPSLVPQRCISFNCNDVRCTGFVSPTVRYPPSPGFSPGYSPRSGYLQLECNQTPDFTGSLASSFYNTETIKQETYHRNEDVFLNVDMQQFPDLPENVEMYTSLVPLENAVPHSISTAFRVVHRQTGEYFAMRRLHAIHSAPVNRLDIWKAIEHSNIVKFHEYFTTQAFGDNSLILVYTYYPSSETLMRKYITGGKGKSSSDVGAYPDPFSSDPDAPRPYTHQKNTMLRAVASGALIPEAVLWSLVIQITAALRALHNAGLVFRSLDLTKVIMNGPRARLAWCGAADALVVNGADFHQAQQDDLTALGRLALSLACKTMHCDNLAASIDLVSRTYSSDFKNVILYLLSTTNRRSLSDLMPIIGARYYTQIEALQRRADVFEEMLASELDNSRIVRILLKLGVVNERPGLNLDGSWSETGNRYLLKLFRDRIFHSVTEDGRAWIDLAHLTTSLNNLDSGSEEQVELTSRDQQSVLVVTYAELKHCLDSAFEEVMSLSARP